MIYKVISNKNDYKKRMCRVFLLTLFIIFIEFKLFPEISADLGSSLAIVCIILRLSIYIPFFCLGLNEGLKGPLYRIYGRTGKYKKYAEYSLEIKDNYFTLGTEKITTKIYFKDINNIKLKNNLIIVDRDCIRNSFEYDENPTALYNEILNAKNTANNLNLN